jgi:hypothetical protein
MATPRRPETPPRPGSERRARVLRSIEKAAKWLSGVIGALVLVGFAVMGALRGDLDAVLYGVAIGGVLLGWVLAVRRLDAGVRALRERLPPSGAQPPAEPPAAS